MGLLDTVNGKTPTEKVDTDGQCWCEYVDIGVGMQRVTNEPDCPEHGHGETVSLIVATESGSYVIDLKNETSIRTPRKDVEAADVYAADLRRDNEEVKVISLVSLQVGEPMVLVLDIRQDGVETLRQTTNVQSITEVYADKSYRKYPDGLD